MNKQFVRIGFVICCSILVLALAFSDNIWGFVRFKSICGADGGLRTYKSLERSVGWIVREGNISYVLAPLNMPEVAFVRYRDEQDGQLYDVHREVRKIVSDPGYSRRPADQKIPVIYEYRWSQTKLEDELRLSTMLHEVVDLRTGSVAMTYRTFSYEQFDPSRALLGSPSAVDCPNDVLRKDPREGIILPTLFELAFSSAFEKN